MSVYRRKYKDPVTGKIRLSNFYFKFTVDGVTYKETVKTARTTKQAEEAGRRARAESTTASTSTRGRGGSSPSSPRRSISCGRRSTTENL